MARAVCHAGPHGSICVAILRCSVAKLRRSAGQKTPARPTQQSAHHLLDGHADLLAIARTATGVAGLRRAERPRTIGLPNRIVHFVGSGIMPSGPSSGKKGVTGR